MRNSFLKIIWLIMSVIFMSIMPNIAASQTTYEVIDLGTLGGTYSFAHGINSAGEVVGNSSTASGDNHAFIYSGGQMTDLGTLGGTVSMAYGINSSGQVVGVSSRASGDQWSDYHAFIYSKGRMTDLGTLGGTYSFAYGINSAGEVVGVSVTTSEGQRAFIYSRKRMTALGTLSGGVGSFAWGINDSGQVVGIADTWSGFRAFIYRGGQMTDLGTLGGTSSEATAINASGQVVGYANDAGDYAHAFLYSGGQMTDLGTLGGALSFAYGINSSGHVVGSAYPVGDTAELAFIYKDGQMIDLNSLIPSNSGWVLGRAQAINDQGQIVGFGSYNGQTRAFLLNPTSKVNLLSSYWDQIGPYFIDYDSNIDGIRETYVVGCAAVAVGQLINHYFKRGYRTGWLEVMLKNTTVYPCFIFEGDTCVEPTRIQFGGYTTQNSYVDSILSEDDPGARELKSFLLYVGFGLDSDYYGASTGTGSRRDTLTESLRQYLLGQDKIKQLLIDRFRFNKDITVSTTTTYLDEEKEYIISSIDQGHPVLMSMYGIEVGSSKTAGHMVLIDGYKISDGIFYVYINWGWGDRNMNATPFRADMPLINGIYGFNSFTIYKNTRPKNYK